MPQVNTPEDIAELYRAAREHAKCMSPDERAKLDFIKDSFDAMKHTTPLLYEGIAAMTKSGLENGTQSEMGASAANFSILHHEIMVLKQQVSNLAGLIADTDLGQHPND